MKLRFLSFLVVASAIIFSSCGNESSDTDRTNAANDSSTADNGKTGNETAPGSNIESTTAAPIREVIDHYLHVKNALAKDNGTEAASGAKAMVASLEKVNASAFTAEQKKVYDDVAADLKEHAEHTVYNANKIDHQREHFIMMSEDVYELVKGFGVNQTLYKDHCPMANNNKGAAWISETEEVNNNPYMGKKMPKCGKLEETIKQ
jgi:hypothetical protein